MYHLLFAFYALTLVASVPTAAQGTRVADDNAGCAVSFTSLVVENNPVPYGASARIRFSIRNGGDVPESISLRMTYTRDSGQPQGTTELGQGVLPPRVTVTRTPTFYIANSTPPGNYNLTLELFDQEGLCEVRSLTLQIVPSPLMGSRADAGEDNFMKTSSLIRVSAAAAPAVGGRKATAFDAATLGVGAHWLSLGVPPLRPGALPPGAYAWRLAAVGAAEAGILTIAR